MRTGPYTVGKQSGIEFRAAIPAHYEMVLTPDAVAFLAKLHREFNGMRKKLLARRREMQREIDQGAMPDFPAATRRVREGDWKVAPIRNDLKDRRVEITGPVERKMIINALNSGASAFMADFEDSNSPTWENNLNGQINLRDAVRRTIRFANPGGKEYALNEQTATLLVRPRGWHLPEKHALIDGEPMAGSLFDFGLYFFHNAQELIERGSGPYFYLPKLESHLEARLWNEVFTMAQLELGIPHGSVRATVLIEHILATFEAEEILYELRDHSSGLNCGRWDYIFSFIKKFRARPEFLLPDRAQITMTRDFMRAYTQHVIKVCHRRGAHAMGGMAAQIPIKSNADANHTAMEKVREDKRREAGDGHDGTWVAHPGLVPIAKEIFDKHMPQPNQIDRQRDDVNVTASDLLKVPDGTITEQGLRTNVNVGVAYLEAWLAGNGCVPLYNLMEDAATCEISRTQIWQWIRNDQGLLEDGRKITADLFRKILQEELKRWEGAVGAERYRNGRFAQAAQIFDDMTSADELPEFLTIPAYDQLD